MFKIACQIECTTILGLYLLEFSISTPYKSICTRQKEVASYTPAISNHWNYIHLPEYVSDLHSRYVVYYQVQTQKRINLSRPHCPTARTQKSSGARHLCNNTKLALPLEKYINVLLNISYEYYLFYMYHIKRNWKICSLIIHQIKKYYFRGFFNPLIYIHILINIKLMEVMIKHFGNLMVFKMLIYNE